MTLFLGKAITVLHRQEQRYMNRIVQQYGLGASGYGFLLCLSQTEGASQKHLCSILDVDEALATRTVKRLETLGYVTRQKNPEDLRRYSLYLTEKGKNLLPKLQETLNDWWKNLTDDLQEEEIETFSTQCQQMAKKAIQLNQKNDHPE